MSLSGFPRWRRQFTEVTVKNVILIPSGFSWFSSNARDTFQPMKSQVFLQGDKVDKVIMPLQCGMCLTVPP